MFRKESVDPFDCAGQFAKALAGGVLLSTNGEKFNSMVIGWGHIGVIWGKPTVTVYVRESRYTKPQLDQTGAFTVSVPVEGTLSPEILRVCGSASGRDVDKAALFTLVPAEENGVPGVLEAPLTLECRVLYAQEQVESAIPEELRARFYSGPNAGDAHTAYIGLIERAYVIRREG